MQQQMRECDRMVASIHAQYAPQMQRINAARDTTDFSPPVRELSYPELDQACRQVRSTIFDLRLEESTLSSQQEQRMPPPRSPGKGKTTPPLPGELS